MKLKPKLRFSEFNGNWKTQKLSDVATVKRGVSKHRPRNAKFLYGGDFPFIQTGDIRNAGLYITEFTQTYSKKGVAQSKIWDEGTLCVTIAANIAETSILKIKACFPDSIIGLIPDRQKTSSLFLKYQFDKFKIDIQKLSQGVAQDNLNQEKLSKIEFNLPTLPEQQKIATFLTTVDEKINLLKTQKSELERYKKGVMQKIFSQKLRFKDKDGKEFPKWEEQRLNELANIYQPKTISQTELKEEGYDVYGANGIIGKYHKFNHEFEQIAITCRGNTCGTVNYTKSKSWITGNAMVINLDKNENVFKRFLYYLLSNTNFTYLITGSGQPQITGNIGTHKVKLPCFEEQTKIAKFLYALDEKIALNGEQITKMEVWKKGLLQQMFV
jgi:type I restriction enzyme S subunit